jgi:hypothetical protein
MHKHFLNFWHKRRERFYRRQKWHLVVDISLFVILIILAAISIRLSNLLILSLILFLITPPPRKTRK